MRNLPSPSVIQALIGLKALALKFRTSRTVPVRITGYALSLIYRTISLYMVGFDVPTSVKIGTNLKIHHGIGLVINDRATIGNNVTLRHNTTIGARDSFSPAPIIEDSVDVGANVVIIGPITVGHSSTIGAGSVVVRNVKPGSTVVGNPAQTVGPVKPQAPAFREEQQVQEKGKGTRGE